MFFINCNAKISKCSYPREENSIQNDEEISRRNIRLEGQASRKRGEPTEGNNHALRQSCKRVPQYGATRQYGGTLSAAQSRCQLNNKPSRTWLSVRRLLSPRDHTEFPRLLCRKRDRLFILISFALQILGNTCFLPLKDIFPFLRK